MNDLGVAAFELIISIMELVLPQRDRSQVEVIFAIWLSKRIKFELFSRIPVLRSCLAKVDWRL
ncbi:hypothetical protein [uncultured Shewanella sp.]|uniref:hypothetical protein n=1 Tax=uncultured Shewanella sp. TaxID=173975 RepID=UPI00261DF860|nr:hypothetical protein [uncultured Shewanella sp.]